MQADPPQPLRDDVFIESLPAYSYYVHSYGGFTSEVRCLDLFLNFVQLPCSATLFSYFVSSYNVFTFGVRSPDFGQCMCCSLATLAFEANQTKTLRC